MKRSDHCTHPNQTWCDCDWCRLVRAHEAMRAPVPRRPAGDLEYPRQPREGDDALSQQASYFHPGA